MAYYYSETFSYTCLNFGIRHSIVLLPHHVSIHGIIHRIPNVNSISLESFKMFFKFCVHLITKINLSAYVSYLSNDILPRFDEKFISPSRPS